MSPLTVGCLGPHTFSDEAFRAQWPNGDAVPRFMGLFDIIGAVEGGDCDLGLLPFYNSFGRDEAPFAKLCDALARSTITAVQMVRHRVDWCALTQNPTPRRRNLYSFKQGLRQCKAWVGQETWQMIDDSPSSTKDAAERAAKDPNGVALGSRLAAEPHGLTVWKSGLQDDQQNATWFCILARVRDAQHASAPLSLIATPERAAGGKRLTQLLPTKLAMPRQLWTAPPWQFLEIQASSDGPIVKEIISLLTSSRGSTRVVGSYQEYDRIGLDTNLTLTDA